VTNKYDIIEKEWEVHGYSKEIRGNGGRILSESKWVERN
jgi:hypothetical protein